MVVSKLIYFETKFFRIAGTLEAELWLVEKLNIYLLYMHISKDKNSKLVGVTLKLSPLNKNILTPAWQMPSLLILPTMCPPPNIMFTE